ncbi:MAG TPA: hypothetical protein VMB53_01155 [Gaiellaceae bacterium]|nr:hypothetical protein [Gaiellaceae bacterium]
MSLTQSIVAIAVLDVAIIAGLTLVMLIPFRLDRRRPATAHRAAGADLLEHEDVAA